MKLLMKTKHVLASILILCGCGSQPKETTVQSKETAAAEPIKKLSGPFHHRFYQGYRIDTVKSEQFEEIINVKFLPLFSLAAPHGLYSYRPALIQEINGCRLPAEIALLSFENEQVYGKYRETDIGKKIRDAHSLVFDFKTSSSLVPENYQNQVALDRAYNLKKDFKDYHDSYSALMVYCQPKSKDPLPALKKIYKAKTQARNILFSVNSDHLAEYIFARNAAQLKKLISERKKKLSSVYKKITTIKLAKEKIGASRIKAGDGLDAQLGL